MSPHHTSQPKAENTKKRFLGRVLGPDEPDRRKRTQRRSSWAEFLDRMAHHTTSHITHSHLITPHHTSHIHISPHQTSHIHMSPHHTLQAERREHKEEVLGPSSWTGWLITPHHTSHIHISSHMTQWHVTTSHFTHQKPKEENTKKKFLGRVLGPDEPDRRKRTQRRSSWAEFLDRMAHHTTSHITHSHLITPHHTSQAERREHKEEVLGPSSWTGWLITPHHTSHMHISSHHITHHTFISHHIKHHAFTCHHITHHKPKEENTKKKFYEFFMRTPFKSIPEERKARELPRKMNIEEVEAPKHQKSTSFIMKTPLRTIPEQRKVRELPRKMNIEEVEEPKKYENYHAKPVSDPFKSIADTRKVRELPRKMNIEEVEEPETTKIHRQNLRPTSAATPKLRKFTYKTNMQTRKHENSDEFCPPPRSSPPAFYYYRKNPKC